MILYKYLLSERVDVLIKRLIRFTQFGAMNDPFEMTTNIDKISEQTNIYELTRKDIKSLIEEEFDKHPVVHSLITKENFIDLALSLKDYLKPFVIQNMNSVIELLPDILKNKFDLEMGTLSLSEKNDDQLMWSHYAENHKGYLIGFDGDHEYFNQKIGQSDELRHLRKIVYKADRPKINLMEPEGVEIFTVKHLQWEYEAEWRMIRPFCDSSLRIDNDKYPIYLFEFPPSAVISVILGCRMNYLDKEKIKTVLFSKMDYSHVKLFQAVLDKELFSIKIERV